MGNEERNGNNDKKYTGYDNRFSTYAWNSEDKTCFGRTAIQWAKLTIFYIMFYIGLACFSGLCYYLFSQTLFENRPKWTLDESLIGTNPGLGFRPMPDPDKNADSTLIWYDQSNSEETNFWSKQLQKYVNDIQTVHPPGEDNVKDCTYTNKNHATETTRCRIDDVANGTFGKCTNSTGFGYPSGMPCILLKLNKILAWEPKGYGLDENGKYDMTKLREEMDQLEKEGMPKDLIKYIKEKVNSVQDKEKFLSTIWISCAGETKADQENLGPLNYYPQQGIPGYYFPYYNQAGYQSPFIFVQLQNPQLHTLVNVECKAWARNIKRDRINRQGSVHFEILIDGSNSNSHNHHG